MMLNKIHPYLSRSFYVFVMVAIFTVCMVSVSYVYMDNKEQDKINAQRAMKIWKNKVDSSRHSNSVIDEYEKTYLYLVNHGVIGSEDRLSWYEAIQETTESRGMPSVKYSVTSQVQFNNREVAKFFKGLDLYRSVMTMDIKMSHEGDLFALMNNLQDSANGLFVVDQCDVERVDLKQAMRSQVTMDNMKAYCELSWYTIRAARAKG